MTFRQAVLSTVTAVSLLAGNASEWRFYGADEHGTRYSSLRLIARSNVGKLQRAWTFHTGEVSDKSSENTRQRRQAFECTPLLVDGVLYIATAADRLIALNPGSGKKLWEFDPQAGHAFRRGHPQRGLTLWEGLNGEKRLFYGTADGRLACVNPKTGRPYPSFANEGFLDLRTGVADGFPQAEYHATSPPVIYRDLVITGAAVPEGTPRGPSGAVRAFDVRSGKLVWQFFTLPRPGQRGHETWAESSWQDRTGVNVWSMMSVDSERGMIFLPTGSASYDFYGGDRPGQNLFANSLVALDARTGKLIWYFQTVHHDLWDYDLPAQPTLVTVRLQGKSVPAVAQVTKAGYLWLLDRMTGKPLFGSEERPVPRSEVPGEQSWPTQPVPLKPPALSRQSVTREELSKATPEHQRFCEELFDSLEHKGMFTPWGVKPTLALPGTLGGATWSGGSFDPASGLYYVNTNETGALGYMKEQPDGAPVRYRRAGVRGEYMRFWGEHDWPCVSPPWGVLTAVNLHTGEIAWKVPLGEFAGQKNSGSPNIGGSIVTAGGLVFIAASVDRKFRAFDSDTGKVLWEAELEAAGYATPMTYEYDGRQFVVIAAGGGGFFQGPTADVVAAYALE